MSRTRPVRRRLVKRWDDRTADYYYVLESLRFDYYAMHWFRRGWVADGSGDEQWASRVSEHYCLLVEDQSK